MNFDEAIKTHSSWKLKLTSYLRQPDGSLREVDVASDSGCQLGKWLNGDGRKYAGLPEYRTLREQHARFHRAAASVVKLAHSGGSTSEVTALGSSSEYGVASKSVVSAIMAMKNKVPA